jgi:hypothetical protein
LGTDEETKPKKCREKENGEIFFRNKGTKENVSSEHGRLSA